MKILFLLFLLLPFVCFSTCVVVVRTAKEITIGAESFRLYSKRNAQGQPITEIQTNWCKIHPVGRFAFATVGFHDQLQIKLATEACTTSETIDEATVKLAESMKMENKSWLEGLRQHNWGMYLFTVQGEYFSIIPLATFQDSQPVLKILYFKVVDIYAKQLEIKYVIKENPRFEILGTDSGVKKIPKMDFDRLVATAEINPVEFIKNVIQIEIANDPQKLGGEIDIYNVSEAENKWLQKKPNCP